MFGVLPKANGRCCRGRTAHSESGAAVGPEEGCASRAIKLRPADSRGGRGICSAVPEWYRDLYYIWFRVGWRPSEILAIRVDWLDFHRQMVHLKRGQIARWGGLEAPPRRANGKLIAATISLFFIPSFSYGVDPWGPASAATVWTRKGIGCGEASPSTAPRAFHDFLNIVAIIAKCAAARFARIVGEEAY